MTNEEQALRDMLEDARAELNMIREALGVPVEPHQTLHERVLEAARRFTLPEGCVPIKGETVRWLLGEGKSFERPADRRGEFWWRHELRKAIVPVPIRLPPPARAKLYQTGGQATRIDIG